MQYKFGSLICIILAIYLKLKYGDFLLIDIVYENGPIKFFCISAVLMLDVSIDTGISTFLHLISLYTVSYTHIRDHETR